MKFWTTGHEIKNTFGMTFHLSSKKIMNKKLAILAREDDMLKRVLDHHNVLLGSNME